MLLYRRSPLSCDNCIYILYLVVFVAQYTDFGQTRLSVLTKAVFLVFALVVPILLLNMLIAMMGNTYQQIISRSVKEQKRQVRVSCVRQKRQARVPDGSCDSIARQ